MEIWVDRRWNGNIGRTVHYMAEETSKRLIESHHERAAYRIGLITETPIAAKRFVHEESLHFERSRQFKELRRAVCDTQSR